MTRRLSMLLWALLAQAVACLPAQGFGAPQRAERQDPSIEDRAIERELQTRRHAATLRARRDAFVLPAPDGSASWLGWAAWWDAHLRAGVAALPSAQALASEEPFVRALALRADVRGEGSAEFHRRVARGLHSTFRVEREAALDRVADELAHGADSGLLAAARAWVLAADGSAAAGRTMPPGTRRDLARILIRSGVGASTVASVAGWTPLVLFRVRLAAPLPRHFQAPPALDDSLDGELAACLAFLSALRGPGDVEAARSAAPGVLRFLSRSPDPEGSYDEFDLDEAALVFVDALVVARAQSSVAAQSTRRLAAELMRPLARGEVDPAATERCLGAVARLLPAFEVLGPMRALDEEAAVLLWGQLDLIPSLDLGPDPEGALEPWLRDGRDDVRETVARALGRRYVYEGERSLEPALRRMLRDAVPTIRSLAFAWLMERREGDAVDRALFEAWAAEAEPRSVGTSDRQREWLGRIPRRGPIPAFRGTLLELARDRDAAEASAIELLGSYRGDAEVMRFLRSELEAETESIVTAVGRQAALHADGRAAALASALARADPPGSAGSLDRVIRRSMARLHGTKAPSARRAADRPRLPKTALALLMGLQGGPALVAGFLAEDAPHRVRYEAALQLANIADTADGPKLERLAATLIDGFDRVDGTLRMRAIAALARVRAPSALRFLEGLARRAPDDAERLAAIDAVASHGALPVLDGLVGAAVEAPVPDLRVLEGAMQAARQLGRIPGANGIAGAEMALDHLQELAMQPTLGEEREALRGLLVASLGQGSARAMRLDPKGHHALIRRGFAATLEAPHRAARDEMRARFRGRKLAPVAFRFQSELEGLAALFQAGAKLQEIAGASMTAAGDPGSARDPVRVVAGLDGRFLAAVGGLAPPGSESAVLALRAAEIALLGEGEATDSERRLVETRLRLARALEAPPQGLAPAAAARERAAALTDVAAALARGRLRGSVLEAVVGSEGIVRVPATTRLRFEAALARLVALRQSDDLGEGGTGTALASAVRDARLWAQLVPGGAAAVDRALR